MMEHKVAILFKDVSFSYQNVEVLKNLSFHIHEGEFVSLVGPNGAGKTTILKLMLGILKQTEGEIKIFGNEPADFIDYIGYVPQYINYDNHFPITVFEVVEMGLIKGFRLFNSRKHNEEVDKILNLMNIEYLKNRQYNSLSGGEKRRVLVARALVSSPKILILDEPTANMDEESEERLYDLLESIKKNTTIIVVTHDSDFVSSLTDVVLCLGKKSEKSTNIKKHRIERIKDYNGKVVRVLHDTELPDDFNCNIKF